VLVGRARERGLLDDLVTATRSGRGGTLGLVGDAGIGKSALLDDLVARAAGVRCLRARSVQSEATLPFAALFELLRPLLGLLGALPDPQREALEGALALRPASRAQDRFAIGAGTLALLWAAAEEGPLLVVVDDAHWLDGSTADALRFAGRRLAADPIGIVVATRPEGRALLDDLGAEVHELGGLDREATAELLRDRTTDADLVARLHAGTGGNPLALHELDPAAVELQGPASLPVPVGPRITDTYAARWAQLPPAAQDVVLLVAASDTGDLGDLHRAADRGGLDLGLVDAGPAAGLVHIGADRAEFRHPLVRSAVYRAADPARRRAAHRLLADTLPDVDADRRAWHLALAAVGPDDAAASAMEQAGDRAWRRSAYDAAWRALERAATLSTDAHRRGAHLTRAAEACWLAGGGPAALALLDAAAAADPDGCTAVDHQELRGHITTRLGPVAQGRRLLVTAGRAAADLDPARAVELLAEAVDAAFYEADASAMAEAAAELREVAARSPGARSEFLAAVCTGMAEVFAGAGAAGVEGHAHPARVMPPLVPKGPNGTSCCSGCRSRQSAVEARSPMNPRRRRGGNAETNLLG